MSRDGFDPYASDSDPRCTRSHADRRLPPLHQVLGDVLYQPSMPCPSRRALSDGWRNHSTPNVYENGPDLESKLVAQQSRHSSPNNTYASSGSSISHPHASTSQLQPPAHSFDLFNYSPSQGLVHQRSSARNDLGIPRTNVFTSDPARKHVCAECGHQFPSWSKLRNHSSRHSGERPFACTHPDCGRRYTRADHVKRHMRTHTAGTFQLDLADDGDRYACTHPGCGRRYTRADHVKRHMRTHIAGTFRLDSADDVDRDTPAGQTTQSSSREGSSRDDPLVID